MSISTAEVEIANDSLLARAPDVLAAALGPNQTVLLPKASEDYLGLDPTGVEIWNALAEPQTLDALISILCGQFDAPPEQIHNDILPFIKELIASGALVCREADATPDQ